MKILIFLGRFERLMDILDIITNAFDYEYITDNNFCIGYELAPIISTLITLIIDVWHEHNVEMNNLELERIAIMTEYDDDFDEN